MSVGDGANYVPQSDAAQAAQVVGPGEFIFSVAFLDHGHIYAQTQGLIDAGATLRGVWDSDRDRIAAFLHRFPQARVEPSFDSILEDPEIALVASAAIPNLRSTIGEQVLSADKHYFTDKSPFTTLDQLAQIERVLKDRGKRYFVYYAERVHNEAAWHAGELIKQGVIGDVIHVTCLAPHRLNMAARPEWFFDKARYGGIITDIGSHQAEQFLHYSGSVDGSVRMARVANLNNAAYPGLEDFGEFSLTSSNGAGFYARVDWFTPDGSPVWGDGRTFIVGQKGTMEIRKYTDPNRLTPASIIFLTTHEHVVEIDCTGKTGFPFFGQLIRDALDGTETAMSQAHIFLAARLSMQAQALADLQHD
ncbi:MAG: Gfo/Idh/MocA family oxidoreductase [Pseudomonadota bacterium]